MCITIEATAMTIESMIAYKVVRAKNLASLIPSEWRSSQLLLNLRDGYFTDFDNTGGSLKYPLHRIISVKAPGTYLFYYAEQAKAWAQSSGRVCFMPALLEVTVPRNTRIYRGTCRQSRYGTRADVLIAQRIRVNKVLEVWECGRWRYENVA